MAERVIPPHHDPACWGCGSAPAGIRLPQPVAEGLTEYDAWFSFDERHQAGPGFVHGGLVAAALDEACGLLATWYRFPAVTARIFVHYRRPVTINTELLVHSWLADERGRRPHVDGELSDGITWVILSTSGGPGGRLGAAFFRRHFDPNAFRRAIPEAIAYRLADPNVTSLERAQVERLRGRYR